MTSKIAIFGLMAGSLAVGGAGAMAFATSRPEAPITYITSPVEVADIESTVMATGTLEPSNIVDVGAQTSGQLQSLTVKVGDTVAKGQKIGQIDPTLLANALKNAQTNVSTYTQIKASQQAQFNLVQTKLNTARALLAQGINTPQQVAELEAQLKSSTASMASMEATAASQALNVQAAEANLEKANVRAPIDGIVAEILINEGAALNATNQAPVILRVAKMDTMSVRAQVSEADVMKINNGQEVYFTVLGEPDVRYDGKLRSLSFTPSTGQLDPSKGDAIKKAIYYNALLDLPNKDGRLRPGMTANVHLVLGRAKQALTIPAGALGDKIDKTHYMVEVQDAAGEVRKRQVAIGLSDQMRIQVTEGLKAGEKVVVGETAAKNGQAQKGPVFALPSSWKS
ncbi:MAG: hemolysin secretion protein [Caulobacteraceae bacterium]|nr:hemolysin secretion protein [Caulobacteraceae bacterium]